MNLVDVITYEFECPSCREVKDGLLYTPCSHPVCDACRKKLFHEFGEPVKCPQCKKELRRKDYTLKSKVDTEFENEMQFRSLYKQE